MHADGAAGCINEAFALHGSTMLFLVSVPVMEAMALWLVPLMLGTRNMAFPRLDAFSFWLYLGGVLMLWMPHAIGHHARSRLVRISALVRAGLLRRATVPTSGRR
jgi:heme/copper-type cytochrome/quinol oxidase subunit 1